MPTQITAADINDVQDRVFELYAGARGRRRLLLDPCRGLSSLGTFRPHSSFAYAESTANSVGAFYRLAVNPGDTLWGWSGRLYNNGVTSGANVLLFTVGANGVRANIAPSSFSFAGRGEKTWNASFGPIVIGANDMLYATLAGNSLDGGGDKFYGAYIELEHP